MSASVDWTSGNRNREVVSIVAARANRPALTATEAYPTELLPALIEAIVISLSAAQTTS